MRLGAFLQYNKYTRSMGTSRWGVHMSCPPLQAGNQGKASACVTNVSCNFRKNANISRIPMLFSQEL